MASVFTLGLLPNSTAEAEATGRAVLLDAGTGEVYERFRSHHRDWKLANAYSETAAKEEVAERTMDRVVRSLMDHAMEAWPKVRGRLARASGP